MSPRDAHEAMRDRCVACQVSQGRQCPCRDAAPKGTASEVGALIVKAVGIGLIVWAVIAAAGVLR